MARKQDRIAWNIFCERIIPKVLSIYVELSTGN